MSQKVKVYDRPCKECLFSKNCLVSEERKNQLIRQALQNNSFFVCHEATLRGENIACYAFIQIYRHLSPALRWVDMNNGFEIITTETEDE